MMRLMTTTSLAVLVTLGLVSWWITSSTSSSVSGSKYNRSLVS